MSDRYYPTTEIAATSKESSSGLPQLNPDSFASQIFWLVVVFVALNLLMARLILPRIREVLAKRQSQIQHDLDAAEKAHAEAEAAKAAYERELMLAKQKSAELMTNTQREIDSFVAAEQSKLKQSLDSMIAKATKGIDAQRQEALSDIQPLMQELASDIAKRFAGKAPTKAQLTKAFKSQTTE
jgi:F-type H+-transporting ATPase subunit b